MTPTTTTVWEIVITALGYEILRDGVSICAIAGDIDEVRARLDELMVAARLRQSP